jgi:hypothetical protein
MVTVENIVALKAQLEEFFVSQFQRLSVLVLLQNVTKIKARLTFVCFVVLIKMWI